MELNYEVDNNYQNVELDNWKEDATKGFMSKNCLNDLFFGNTNMEALQMGMRNMVANATDGKEIISKQNEIELKVIMRSIYLQYGKNQNTNLQGQIRELNKHVLKYCVENIHSNLKQYNGYISDITKERDVMEMPQFVHTKGDKTLMPRHFI